jgi:hypothetical protein
MEEAYKPLPNIGQKCIARSQTVGVQYRYRFVELSPV